MKSVRKIFSAFTLAELIVVVTILSVLSTIGFMALSQYGNDAKDAAAKSNVRSIYTAISAESAVTGNSSRYYVVHDSSYALTGSAIVVFDGTPVMLAGGDWNAPGTNYSAGNPDYAKLRLNKEKFKISKFDAIQSVFAAADPSYVLVGAADVVVGTGAKVRQRSFAQTAALLSNGTALVSGDFPSQSPGSVAGLVRDAANGSSTGALVDGGKTGSAPGCAAAMVSGYSVGALSSGQSVQVSKTAANGSVTATASCSFGTLSVGGDSAVCDSGYVASGLTCIADVCGSVVPAHATSTATSQSVSGTWHYAATPAQCTFACAANYSWDAATSSCKADCQLPVSTTHSGLPYALSATWTLVHGASANRTGTSAFWVSPANGSLTANFVASCNDGAVGFATSNGTASCQSNYAWNSSWSSPACSANSQTATCGGSVPANASATTATTYSQTWNGSAWAPAYSWTNSASTCGFSCASGYAWNGSSCVANAWSSGAWGACSGETGSWSYGAWGSCSVSCWGGTQSRIASCTRNSNGTQSRAVQCLRYDGVVLADADCLVAKPGVSQSCTQGTDAVCGAATTSQSCNTQACSYTYSWIATSNFVAWWGYNWYVACRRSDWVDIKTGYAWFCNQTGWAYVTGQTVSTAICPNIYTDNTYAALTTCP